jgi:peptide chain release factor 3
MSYTIARWVSAGWEAVHSAGRLFNTQVVKDVWGRPVLLFRNEYSMQQVLGEAGEKLGELSSYGLPPDS